MFTKAKIAGLVMGLMALSVPMVFADNGGGTKDSWHQDADKHQGHEQMMAKILGLSDEQVKQLKDLHEKQKDMMKGAFEQMKSNREALNTEIIKANPDMNKINDLQAQKKTLLAQMEDNSLNGILAIKKIMTPEQFAGYMALKKEKMMKMHGRHQFSHSMTKDGDEHKNWGAKSDKDQDSDDK
jgi:Spy/CpxP family protein refolding chaperone